MKVLMVSDVCLPRINGVSSSINTFRRALQSEGVEVNLIAPRYSDESDEMGTQRIRSRTVPFDPEDRLMAWRPLREAVEAAAREADIVHLQTPFSAHYAGLKAARNAGRPVLSTYHTLFEEYLHGYMPGLPRPWLKAFARQLSRSQCNALDAVVVPSQAMCQRLADYGVTAPMHVVPTGIAVGRYAGGSRAAFREQHGIAADRPVALFVGRVAHEKNIDFLLDAMVHALPAIPTLLLVIAGDGPAMPNVRARIAALGLEASVLCVGYLDGERELPHCYAAADVFAFASLTETQGLVLLEAMAAGLPVVALSSMGTADLLAAQQGSVAPPADPAVFAHALAQLLSDSDRHALLRQQATEHAAQWSDVGNARRLKSLYQSLIGAQS